MEVRQMATAFLFHENRVLMMKKSGSRVYPGVFWTGLGGHLEPNELNHPRQACLREICEESGLGEQDLRDFSLKYILLRLKEDEIRQQFVYFGKTVRTDAVPSEEGELFWVGAEELPTLQTSKIVQLMLEHYLTHPDSNDVMVGTIAPGPERVPQIQWARLIDPMVF